MRSEIKIIAWSAILAALSLTHLTWLGHRAMDTANQTGIWSLAFDDPSGKSLDFRLSNFGSDPNFQWKVIGDSGNVIAENSLKVISGQSFDIKIDLPGKVSGRVEVVAKNNTGQRKIYKSF